MVHWGLGRHISTLSPEQLVGFLKWSCLSQIPGVLSTSLARISVAILLWRLFGIKAWFRWYLYVMTALLTAVALTVLVVWGAQCRPINALWGPAPGGSCWNPNIQLAITQVFQCQFPQICVPRVHIDLIDIQLSALSSTLLMLCFQSSSSGIFL